MPMPMPREMTNRAVTVARISGGPGQDKYLSHGGQDKVMFDYCRKKGLDVVRSFYEVNSALFANRRPDFLDVIEFVLNPENRISHVVFYDLSRFTRSKADPHTYLNLLDERDVIIHSASNDTNSDDDNELLWDVTFIFNHEYSRTVSKLTIRGQSDSVLMGNDISPVVSYGYEKYYKEEGGKPRPRWKPHPEHAKIVLLIFNMRKQKFLPMAICNHLNGLEIPAPRGGLWTTNTIINILRNITYLGYSQVGKNPTFAFPKHRRHRELVQNPNAHQGIVPEDIFNDVQKLMPRQPRAERKPPNSEGSPNPISDRVKCGNPNHRLANMVIANSKGGRKKLMCSVKKNSGVIYCKNPDVDLDDFIRTLGTSLKDRLSVPSVIEEQQELLAAKAGEHIAQEKSRQETIAKRLKSIDQEKANLMAGLQTAKDSFPENVQDFNQALAILNKEKEQLIRKQRETDDETQELMAFLTDPEGLRETIQQLGDQIDPEYLEVTSKFLNSFINRVDISDEEATMYYSMPLAKTVETQTGHRASATIERGGPEILLEHSAPALAGIDRRAERRRPRCYRFPRTRGDRPPGLTVNYRLTLVPPHSRG